MCPDAAIGDSATLAINGVEKTFTKRDRDGLDALIAADENDEQIALTCTSGIVDMSDMFYIEGRTGREDFNQDLSSWDVSNVTAMAYMFTYASAFNGDISLWDVSSVTSLAYMFSGASAFNQDLSKWNVSKVNDMHWMFRNAKAFNQDLSKWDVSNVTDMHGMFEAALAFNQDLSSWDVSKVMDMRTMFKEAAAFNQDLSNWCVALIDSKPIEFDLSSALTGTNLPKWGEACWDLVPSEYEVSLDDKGDVSIVGDDINFTHTSSSNIVKTSLSQSDFSCSDVNQNNEVTLRVENEDGDFVTAVLNVKVLDQSPPVLQSKTITLDLEGEASVSLEDLSLLVESLTDNCTVTSDITLSVNQDTFTSTGTYTIELTAEDASKNSTTTNVEVKVEDATLSANEFSNQASFKLYPNPASNHITFEASDDKIKAIHIYDMMGRLVLTSQKLSFSLHNLPTGMYLAKVFNYVDQTSTVLKFIKE